MVSGWKSKNLMWLHSNCYSTVNDYSYELGWHHPPLLLVDVKCMLGHLPNPRWHQSAPKVPSIQLNEQENFDANFAKRTQEVQAQRNKNPVASKGRLNRNTNITLSLSKYTDPTLHCIALLRIEIAGTAVWVLCVANSELHTNHICIQSSTTIALSFSNCFLFSKDNTWGRDPMPGLSEAAAE